MLQRVADYFRTRPLLLILLSVDCIFIAIHIWLWSRGNLPWEFHLGRQASYPEQFQYLKWFASALLCILAFARCREALYLAWAALFLYLLLDDSLEIHEALGPVIAELLERGPAYGLRGKDFGEVLMSLGVASLLLGIIALCYWRSRDSSARALTLALLPWLAILALCGIGVDVAKRIMRVFYDPEWAVMIAGIVEDGGEMIAASFLTATVAHAVLASAREPRPTRCGKLRAMISVEKNMRAADLYILASIGVVLLFTLVMALAVLAYFSGIMVGPRPLYRWLLREDSVVETLTAILLILAAALAVAAAIRMPDGLRWSRLFLFLFAPFCVLMALEEISWGQRLFGLEPGEFFVTYSDQREIGLHNVMQQYLQDQGSPIVWARKIAALVLFVYGVILPILNRFPPVAGLLRKLRLVVPPPALVSGFFLGSFLCWADWPTGREEELGEFLFALCFALLVPLWLLQQRYVPGSESSALARATPL